MLSPGTTRNGLPTASPTNQPLTDPEVLERPHRRRFTAAYKLQVVQEADAAIEFKQVGALLRREGLYSSQLAAWRRLRDAGALSALGQARGRKPAAPADAEVARLQRENAQLTHRLAVAEEIIAVQKKVSSLLGIVMEEPQP
jgi:transposase